MKTAVQSYFDTLAVKCGHYRIKYVPVDVNEALIPFSPLIW